MKTALILITDFVIGHIGKVRYLSFRVYALLDLQAFVDVNVLCVDLTPATAPNTPMTYVNDCWSDDHVGMVESPISVANQAKRRL